MLNYNFLLYIIILLKYCFLVAMNRKCSHFFIVIPFENAQCMGYYMFFFFSFLN